MYPVELQYRPVLEDLLNDSTTSDVHFRLVRAVRVENSARWARYQEKAADIRRRRGICSFAGRGAPLTSRALAEVDSDVGFAKDLDSSICEVYLWHGTKPKIALKIAYEGFDVGKGSAAGKRFGNGGYFAEDPSKADKYSSSGEGLYKDCYAMMLCRVVLGKQFRTDAYRSEDVTSAAKGRHDSTLAEPKGTSVREFIAHETNQVYPEYALIYERCEWPSETGSSCSSSYGRGRRRSDSSASTDDPEVALAEQCPVHWLHAAVTSDFHETWPERGRTGHLLQALMLSSWDDGGLRASRGVVAPLGLHVLRVLRVEDAALWAEYAQEREAIRARRPRPARVRVASTEALAERRPLDLGVNETYLWYGSSPEDALNLSERRIPMRCDEDGSVTLQEQAWRADEQSEDDKDGCFAGHFAMLLCRAVLGEASPPSATDRAQYDSLVWESSSGSANACREFVLPSSKQIYPEYLIMYERVYPSKTPASQMSSGRYERVYPSKTPASQMSSGRIQRSGSSTRNSQYHLLMEEGGP
eukprot:TRINITY_DN12734_c0_g1_i4.p1 TRINITY_DN12734_c0_g1~~TRINITY_DN12734_c0_g1_i4.p1  ORF type:complete len:529 (+),score=107.59 TRINITY_DN12734_c0_g1_i4:126-1712(+)